ncbi:unnamed protein product, partial [marine sediment metagenome]
TFTPGEVPKAIQTPLMNKTNHSLLTKRYTFTMNVVEPTAGFAVDPDGLENSTVTYQKSNGKRFTYGGVYSLSSGAGAYNGTEARSYENSYGAESHTAD